MEFPDVLVSSCCFGDLPKQGVKSEALEGLDKEGFTEAQDLRS